MIGNGEAGVVNLNRNDMAARLVEQRDQGEGEGIAALQKLDDFRKSSAGIDDIFHDNDVVIRNIAVQVHNDFDVTCGNGA